LGNDVTSRSNPDEPTQADSGPRAAVSKFEGAELQANEARFQRLVENMADIVVELNAEGTLIWLSPSVESVLGRTAVSLIGQSVRPIVHPDDRAALGAGLKEAYASMNAVGFSYRMKHADGRWRWIEGSGRCFLSDCGETYFVGVGRDATEYKQLVQTLERQHAADRQIVELSRRFVALAPGEIDKAIELSLDELVTQADADRAYLLAIGGGESFFIRNQQGWTQDELDRADSLDSNSDAGEYDWAAAVFSAGRIIHIPDTTEYAERVEPIVGRQLADRGVRSLIAVPLESQGRVIGCLALECHTHGRAWSEREITELQLISGVFSSVLLRKRAEVALAEQIRMERRISELSNRFLAAATVDLQDAVREVLQGSAEMARADHVYMQPLMQESDPDSITVGGFYPIGWHTPDLDVQIRPLPPWCETELRAGRTVHFDSKTRHSDEAEHARAVLAERGVRAMIGLPLFSKYGAAGMLAFECYGKSERWSEHEVSALGLIGELFSASLQRLQAEEALEESRTQLLHAQKMDAVGRLAGGIAHDFNNLLTIILGFSEDLSHAVEPGSSVQEDIAEITNAAERASDLTRQLLAFSRREQSYSEHLDLNEVVRGMREMLARLLGSTVRLIFEPAGSTCPVYADVRHIEQVLINLAVNARDAMPSGGTITVRTVERILNVEECRRYGLDTVGQYSVLEVEDTGEGMSAGVLDRIFEPFYTTKDVGKGTGLGLSIAYSVAREHMGAIGVESRIGLGSAFSLLLPRSEMEVAPRELRPERPARYGRGTVLVVDDEPALRRLVGRCMRAAGYQVLEAESGTSALALVARGEDQIDLLLTDVMMAEMSGRELARTLRVEHPTLPIVYMSGHPLEDDADRDVGAPWGRFVRKPFSKEELLDAIQSELDDA
jgi:PAS domain S-box-containing protein